MGTYEKLKYNVIQNNKPYQIREYEAFKTSSVKENDLRGNSGFSLLFGYIQGNNEKNQKISMTVPVLNEFATDTTMEFVLPNKFHTEDVPVPTNEHVRIKEYPTMKMAVLTFRGRTTEKIVKAKVEQLLTWLTSTKEVPAASYFLARYNPPFVPAIFRTNEILIPLKQ